MFALLASAPGFVVAPRTAQGRRSKELSSRFQTIKAIAWQHSRFGRLAANARLTVVKARLCGVPETPKFGPNARRRRTGVPHDGSDQLHPTAKAPARGRSLMDRPLFAPHRPSRASRIISAPRRRPFTAGLLALALALGGLATAHAQEDAPDAATSTATGPGSIVKGTYGAWQVSCRTPPGAKEEKCALVQSVTAEDRPNVGLTVVFYKAVGEDKKLLRVVVPLGVLLPTGLGLKIDNQDVGNAPCSSSLTRRRPASASRSRCKASARRSTT
jgi:invasion protein IalB